MSLKYRKLPQALILHSHINTSAIMYIYGQLWTTLPTHVCMRAHTLAASSRGSKWTQTCYNVWVILQHLWIYRSGFRRPELTVREEELWRGKWWLEAPRSPAGEKTWSTWLVLRESMGNCLLTPTGHRAPSVVPVSPRLFPSWPGPPWPSF